jgi:hypothetical protein
MPSQVQNGYAHIEMTWQATTQARVSVVTLDTYFPPGTPLPTALSATVGAFLAPSGLLDITKVHPDYTLVRSSILARSGGALYSYVNDTPTTGASGSIFNCPPCNTTIVVQKKTIFAGRDGRGHMMLPPCRIDSNNVSSGGILLSGDHTDLQDGADATYAALATSGYQPVLNHTATIANPHPVPTVITEFLVKPVLGSDKRRIRQ